MKVKGKKNILKILINLGLENFEEFSGEVKIKEVNNHDLDDDFEVIYLFF